MAAVCLLLLQLPVLLLWHLLYWPHLHISNLMTQTRRDEYTDKPPFNADACDGIKARERKKDREIPGHEEGHWGQMSQHWLCLLLSNTEEWRKEVLLMQQSLCIFTLRNTSGDSQSNVHSYFHTLIHWSCFLWITVVVPEGKLSLHYSRRYTL